MHGEFSWIDLSTFDVARTEEFYADLFGWQVGQAPAGYYIGSVSGTPVAGFFEMPELFQKINMPSFWMSYIAVDDVDATVTKVKELGGKVELETSGPFGRVALIRDPSGAGFTCYEGTASSVISPQPTHGRWHWSELFVSNFSKVRQFYSGLFGWNFEPDGITPDRSCILNRQGRRIGAIQVASNDIKGDKEFWAIFFGVDDIPRAISLVNSYGGEMIYEHTNSEGTHYLVKDPQGAAFFLTATHPNRASTPDDDTMSKSDSFSLKWRSLIGLALIYTAVLFKLDWMWGVLFLFWVIPDLKTGTTCFIEPLSRKENPLLYWTVVVTWIVLSLFLLLGVG